ncbi:hypothetical protein YN1551_2410 [Sulfolobus islandicus Y.N.15.51]|uniref:Uncharacterized protein n=1 Tax=Saccharolobus islandicus (strain Y.N.15.51 / Yellowstone \|nr:hypothetical protein [Sulfolobus islandicus]ACP49378.1 hypothetical protein YN1551_2410 [Sulfolobus islandicus Y.N.15.51]
MKFLLEEEELVCKYFNPTKELYDLEYIRLAKTFLNAYLRQELIKEGEFVHYFPSIEYTFAEMLSFIYDKCAAKLEREVERKNEELMKIKYLELHSLIPSLVNFNASLFDILSSIKLGFVYDAILKVAAEASWYIVSELMLRRLHGIFRSPEKSKLADSLKIKIQQLNTDPSKFLKEIEKYVKSPEIKRFINNEISIDEIFVKRLAKKLKRVRKKYFKQITFD